MPFTHYPKLEENTFLAACWYGKDDPRSATLDVFGSQALKSPPAPGKEILLHGCAQNFTRFYSTLHADQPVKVTYAFSNEDRVLVPRPDPPNPSPAHDKRLPEKIRKYYPIDVRGRREITDEDLPGLNYDGVAMVQNYKPASEGKPAVGDKALVTIYGRWLRVVVANMGEKPVGQLRFYLRASVF